MKKFKLLDEVAYLQFKNVIEMYNSESSFQRENGDKLYLTTIKKISGEIWIKYHYVM